MTLTLPMEKSKKLTLKCRNLITSYKLQEITSLIGSLCSTAQTVEPAFLQIRHSYHSLVHLYQNSIQGLVWRVSNLEITKTIIQTDASQQGWDHTVRKYQ